MSDLEIRSLECDDRIENSSESHQKLRWARWRHGEDVGFLPGDRVTDVPYCYNVTFKDEELTGPNLATVIHVKAEVAYALSGSKILEETIHVSVRYERDELNRHVVNGQWCWTHSWQLGSSSCLRLIEPALDVV
jgi:hypothetical protein